MTPRTRFQLALVPALFIASLPANAADSGMSVQTWDPGCEHTMETNHFELAPGASVEIQLDFSGCTPEQLGAILLYGYVPRNSGSDALTKRHNVRLHLVDETSGSEAVSDDGHIFSQLLSQTQCVVVAENMSRRKSITLRLVSRSGL